jgi:hypothetical protein
MTKKERKLFERMYFLLQRVDAELSKIETKDIYSKLSLLMVIKKILKPIIIKIKNLIMVKMAIRKMENAIKMPWVH